MVVGLVTVVFSSGLVACSGDDDDDTFGLDSGATDATTSDSAASDAASDAASTGDSAVDAGFDANSLTCVGGGGTCALSGPSCVSSGGSLVGTPEADNFCTSTGFGASSVCCTTVCGASPGDVCPFGTVGIGPPYCQQGEFVCPNGTIVDAGARDSGIVDASDDGG
jgi:hypothetical protein